VRGGILTEQVINGHRAVYLKSCGRHETVYVEVLLREVFGPGATCAPRQLADSWR
jgi:hypothetical protein